MPTSGALESKRRIERAMQQDVKISNVFQGQGRLLLKDLFDCDDDDRGRCKPSDLLNVCAASVELREGIAGSVGDPEIADRVEGKGGGSGQISASGVIRESGA